MEEPREARHPALRVRGQAFVGQHFVARQADDARPRQRQEEPQVPFEGLGRFLVGLHAHERPLQRAGDVGERIPARRAPQSDGAHLPLGSQRCDQFGDGGGAPRARREGGLQLLHRTAWSRARPPPSQAGHLAAVATGRCPCPPQRNNHRSGGSHSTRGGPSRGEAEADEERRVRAAGFPAP